VTESKKQDVLAQWSESGLGTFLYSAQLRVFTILSKAVKLYHVTISVSFSDPSATLVNFSTNIEA
jgi:hypothetical protein